MPRTLKSQNNSKKPSTIKIVTNTDQLTLVPSKSPSTKDKFNRKLILNISVFLLGKEKMKDTYWSIVSCKYQARENELKVGVSTVDNKLGTTLKNMRAYAGELARFMKDQSLLPKVAKVSFYVYKPEEESYLDKLNNLIDSIELNLNTEK